MPYALLALSHGAFAAQPPNAGSQMQQIPPAPTPLRAPPKVDIQQGNTPAMSVAETRKIHVKRLHVTGAQSFTQAELIAATGFLPGSDLTLVELRAMIVKIADHYHQHGYFIAQAYLPPQEITNGDVAIVVVEGQYGRVSLNNQSTLANSVAESRLAGLQPGDAVTAGPLEHRLLLLADLPGVRVKSTLLPGAAVGASDLIVDIQPGPRVNGSVDADNAGNRYTGENRVGATVNLNNPTGRGDVVSLRALTSGRGFDYARAAYQMPIGKATAGVAYSRMNYRLGREFAGLDASGSAEVVSLYGSYPLIRSRTSNLYAGLALDGKKFRDDRPFNLGATREDKRAQVAMGSLYGDHLDRSGFSTYSLVWSSGNIDLQTPAVRLSDAATAQTQGHFQKLGFSASRLQRLTDTLALYAGINGQWASKNLDTSEKIELGGMYAVRAYPEGESYADEGYVLNLEIRKLLPKFSALPGQIQVIGFVDTGTVTLNKKPWDSADNTRTLSGTGLGLHWSEANNFLVRAYISRKLGNEEATSAPDRSSRFWIQAVKYF